MMPSPTQRVRDQLLIALAVIALLFVGRSILVPLAYSLLTAMVLYPVVSRMERGGIPRAVAIALGLVAVAVLFSCIGFLLLWEANAFLKGLPALSAHAQMNLDTVQEWIGSVFGLSQEDQAGWAHGLLGRLPDSLGPLFVRTANAVFGMAFNLFIIPVFTSLLLYDRRTLMNALVAFVTPGMKTRIPSILQRSVHRFASFIVGMVKVYVIVGVLNSIGLLLLGVPNAILFGMLTAVMTIVPYVGIMLSALLPISVAWIATGSIWSPLGVVAVFAAVQYVEANLIFPKVVGSQLGLNTLASIVIVLAGAILWGVSGMILLLPYVSILMIIAEDIPGWRPVALLLAKGTSGITEVPPKV
ncbi:MAG: AI-2E family transporter [Flavobacteriales bacterium]|nr:AI-2E family transporter [Flavobacteriales bacterium]